MGATEVVFKKRIILERGMLCKARFVACDDLQRLNHRKLLILNTSLSNVDDHLHRFQGDDFILGGCLLSSLVPLWPLQDVNINTFAQTYYGTISKFQFRFLLFWRFSDFIIIWDRFFSLFL